MKIIFPEIEKRIINFWKREKIFEKSLNKKGENFVFYEGPPTANGRPGIHHIVARAFKDIVCRYQTMQGKKVLRKAGWDVHGLPVELEVEKELGIKSKKEIEDYGIAKFNEKCKESVWKYKQEWEDLTTRIGYWLDMDNPYITSDFSYVETVFNIIKRLWDKDLIYKGYRVSPYCPRCGTGLSSHELAQGYKKIKEPAVYIKFKLKDKKNTHLLVWTTTPWTLTANVAIAVNPNIDYILAKKDNDQLILADSRRESLGKDFEVTKKFKGKELVGLKYEPLFEKSAVEHKEKSKNIYQVLSADFVNTKEGTGLVHVAPAFGQDDMELIKKQKKDFPILVTVDEEGKFNSEVKKWKGKFVKKADSLIIEHLESKGKLFMEEQYEHDYPFCWRCDTPLLYYPKESWFIKTTAVKDELIKNNQKINWIPEHIKDGRFGEWLNELKDWALSRERYWGTPLPIWQCMGCGHQTVIGSRDDLRKQKFSTNKYFLLRHGEAESNAQGFLSSYPEAKKNSLTKRGKKEVEKSAKLLKEKNIDVIISSDILRTKMTAEIVAKETKLKPQYSELLREVAFGDVNGEPVEKMGKIFNLENLVDEDALRIRFEQPFPNGENWADIRVRVLNLIKDIDKKYHNKNILIVSHQLPLTLLESSCKGETIDELVVKRREKSFIKTAEVREIDFNQFPYNPRGEIDFHRPFIDEIEFQCSKCGKQMNRVKDVIDCWFDSGSMPFSQRHWPFDNKSSIIDGHLKAPELFPADYVAEAIDQTRGWFYTLLAISTLLDFGPSYKNVICLGLVLDEKGQKMSKSKGNAVDPWKMMDIYGADALRWHFYTMNQPGASKLFSEYDLDKNVKKFLMTFWNCYKFLDLYKDKINKSGSAEIKIKNENILDKWIVSKINRLIENVSKELDEYNITTGARIIEDFAINDLSLWYIRRSRKRFQDPKTSEEFDQAFSVLRFILCQLSKIISPFVPFVAEEVYQNLSDKKIKSVHLTDWPKADKGMIDDDLEEQMEVARKIVALGLKLRSSVSIKVRQPLSKLEIVKKGLKIDNDLLNLVKDELNVKNIMLVDKIKEKNSVVGEEQGIRIAIDIKITPELKQEGMIREIVRQIQQMRKNANYKPKDKVEVYAKAEGDLNDFLNNNKKELAKQAKTEDFIMVHKEKSVFDIEKEQDIDGLKLWLGLKLVVK